jgi:hypothetical protein
MANRFWSPPFGRVRLVLGHMSRSCVTRQPVLAGVVLTASRDRLNVFNVMSWVCGILFDLSWTVYLHVISETHTGTEQSKDLSLLSPERR